MLRALPNMLLFRPCDGNEVSGAYAAALSRPNTPSTLALSRQGMPVLSGTSLEAVERGAYALNDEAQPDVILASSGSEVNLCVTAAASLTGKKVRVVSMPCWELFEEQSLEYRLSVFPAGVPVLRVEASGVSGW